MDLELSNRLSEHHKLFWDTIANNEFPCLKVPKNCEIVIIPTSEYLGFIQIYKGKKTLSIILRYFGAENNKIPVYDVHNGREAKNYVITTDLEQLNKDIASYFSPFWDLKCLIQDIKKLFHKTR